MSKAEKQPEAAAVWVPIEQLTPWDRNPRKNDGEPVRKVMESIKRFGFGAPILARKADGEVIAGHTRLKAAQALGLDKVPVRYLELDPAEAHLLALADNRLNEKAEWDTAVLTQILGEYGFDDIDVAGWDKADLEKLADLGDDSDRTQEPIEEDRYTSQFAVTVVCASESEQRQVYDRLTAEGLNCKVVVV